MKKIMKRKLVKESLFGGKESMSSQKINYFRNKYDKEELGEVLVEASAEGNLADVKYLVEYGDIDISPQQILPEDKFDKNEEPVDEGVDIGGEALLRASENGHLRVVKYLAEQGANIYYEGLTKIAYDDVFLVGPLAIAAKNGHLNIIKYLVEEQDVNVDEWYGDEGDSATALTISAWYGHLDVAKYLVEQGANIRDEYELALSWAVERGYLDIVKFLVEQSEDLGLDIPGEVLEIAKESGRQRIVKYLNSKIENE